MLHLKQKSPSSYCVYLADSKNFPYGEKTPAQITSCAESAVQKILSAWNPRVIVVACNTISVTALSELRNRFPGTPFVGTVPAVKLGAETTRNHVIGLLATNATVHHEYVKNLEREFAGNCTIVPRGDPELVSFIEHKFFTATDSEKREAVRPAVDFFAQHGCDSIILGCTHFLHLAKIIAEEAGSGVTVVDSREGVANQALRVRNAQCGADDCAGAQNSADNCDAAQKKAAGRKEESSHRQLPLDESLFVTGFTKSDDDTEYDELCRNLHIPFGGII